MSSTDAAFRCQLKSGRLCILNSGKIYDVTDFADRHPGGKKLLDSHVGQDVTKVMNSSELHKHSPAALKILDKYYVGEYSTSNDIVHRRKATNGKATNGHQNGFSNGFSNGISADALHYHDDLLDWSKPILSQVGGLGDKYMEWVHSPIDTPIRLFENDTMEMLSTAYWWSVPLVWLPFCFYFLWNTWLHFSSETVYWNIIGFGRLELTTIHLPILFLLGVVLWTLDEYVLHRWLFHRAPPSNSKFFITTHFLLHGQHHKSPMDRMRLVFPQVPGSVLAIIVYLEYWLIAPAAVHHVLYAGTLFGYICYDLTHYYLHHGSPSSSYFKDLKTYHTKHHFKDQDNGFGISSKLWDIPFGTLIR